MSTSSLLSSPPSNLNSSVSVSSSPTTSRQKIASRSPSNRNRRVPRRRARGPQQKLVATLQLWREQRWGIKAFLKQWIKAGVDGFTNTRRINLLQEALEDPEIQTALASANKGYNHDLSTERLVDEFNVLIGKDFFNKCDHPIAIENIDYSLAFKVIESNAPTWTALLTTLMSNQRHDWSSYGALQARQPNQQRAYFITALLCRCRAQHTASFLAKSIGIYLHGSGVKRRVLELLAGLGICDSYKTVHQMTSNIAGNAKASALSLNIVMPSSL
jgi:hypothetical protein